jgi:two-component system, NarL family, response regulator DesR
MRRKFINSAPDGDVVRVLVVDDHALFAEALMLTLGIDDRIQVVGSASSGTEAVSLAKALTPDVVLMDIHMPSMDGIEATRHVRRVSPRSRVVIVSAARSPELAAHARLAGAERYLTKDTPAVKLIDAIVEMPRTATVTPLVPREARIA